MKILSSFLAIFFFNFSSIKSSNNFKIHLDSDENNFACVSTEQATTSTSNPKVPVNEPFSRVNIFNTNTLMIDAEFQSQWVELLSVLENLLPITSKFGFKYFPYVDPQSRLISAITNNDPRAVKIAIDNGASFLTIDFRTSTMKTMDLYPIEYAVTAGKILALMTMLDFMIKMPPNLMNDLLGGLLIKAIQAGQFASIKLLIRYYEAPYMENSFLLQKAVMHHSSVLIIEYLMRKFAQNPELFKLYGNHKDSLLHLAIRFNNFEAFSYFYHREDIEKNINNGSSLAPIDLLASLPFKWVFFQKLINKHPDILTSWTDDYGNNLLHLAAYHNNLVFTRHLIEKTNFPIDRKNNGNLTALLISYFAVKRDIAIYLVENGADVFHKDKDNTNVLIYALKYSDFKFFRSCLEIISSNDRLDRDALKVLHLQLIKEDKSNALVILLEIFPFLNKEEY